MSTIWMLVLVVCEVELFERAVEVGKKSENTVQYREIFSSCVFVQLSHAGMFETNESVVLGESV